MKYFSTLPSIAQPDGNGNVVIATNLLARTYFQENLKNNLNVMYEYDIKDGDTPENIAHRYYGSVDRFWIILMSNGIIDPQWQWPLTNNQFNEYIFNKYSEAANTFELSTTVGYTQSTVHHYERDITTFNSNDEQKQTITLVISEEMYNEPIDELTTIQIDNSIVTKQVTNRAVSLYDYELGKNESNRRIKILRDVFVNQIENQFKKLMQ